MRGERAVHGLYDFLLNDTGYAAGPAAAAAAASSVGFGGMAGSGAAGDGSQQQAGQVWDLPQVVAPVPFEGATVWRPALKVCACARI